MNNPVSLTIGMIVKNEKEHLETCLRSLQPLRDALDCQLIITDTGSEDGTQEIASRYADDYIEFAWCDDFSKARNTGVDRAKGRWFLYVDADHEFDHSLLELIPFLNTPSVDDLYDSASVTIVNYTGSREHITGSFTQQRPLLVNFSKGKRYFQHRIHESIPVHPHATYTLPTTLKHWGYLEQERKVKSQRNRRLLDEQIKEDPHNLKHHFQRIKDVDTLHEKKELLLSALALGEAQTQSEDPRLLLLYTHLLKLALEEQDWALFQETQARRPEKHTHSILHCDYLGLCLHAALLRGNATQALSLFTQFRPLFFQLQEKPDSEYGMLDSYTYGQTRFYYQIEPQVLTLLQAQHTPTATHSLRVLLAQSQGLAYSITYEQTELFSSYLALLTQEEMYPTLAEHYPSFQSSPVLRPLFYQFVGKIHWTTDFFQAFSELPPDYFTSLCKAWVDGLTSLSSAQTDALKSQGDFHTNPLTALLLYPLFKEKQTHFSLFCYSDTPQLLTHSQKLLTQAPQILPLLVESITEYSNDFPLPSQKCMALSCHCLLLHLLQQGNEPQARTLFPLVQKKIAHYCHTVYNDWVATQDSRDLLSPPERLSLAYEEYETHPTPHTQKMFSSCLQEFPLFSALLPLIAPSTSLSSSPPDPTPSSISSLASQTKEQMLKLIQEGKKEEALALFQSNQTLFQTP